MGKLLTNDKIEEMYDKASYILENIGVNFWTEKSCAIFREAGAKVKGKRVYISRKLFEDTLALTPKYKYCENPKIRFDYSTPFGNVPLIYDDILGKHRRGTIEDLIKVHKIVQISPDYTAANLSVIDPAGANEENSYLSQVALMLKYTDKFFINGFRATYGNTKDKDLYRNLRRSIQLMKDFTGKEKVTDQFICPMAPLAFDIEALENLEAALDEGQPVSIGPCTVTNFTGPASLIGVAIHNLAMCMAGNVYVQLYRPESKTCWWDCTAVIDMRSMKPMVCIESFFVKAAVFECSRYLSIYSGIGVMGSDSVFPDYQAGAESVFSAMFTMSLTDLPSIFLCPGKLGNSLVGNFRKLFYDEDMIGYMNRGLEGMCTEVSDNLFDEIIAGVKTNNFIFRKTPPEYRRDHYLPKIMNRYGISMDSAPKKRDIAVKADIEMKKRLDAYIPLDLTDEQKKLIKPHLPECERDF